MGGVYAIFEGSDGVGKSTITKAVAESVDHLVKRFDSKLHLTHHPGSTPLGAHLRKLVKTPQKIDEDIVIDPLSRQLLYMADTISFGKNILEPALARNEFVFADRSSFISAIAYAGADGMSLTDVNKLFALYEPPKADRLYILSCPWSIAKKRIMKDRKLGEDHYDKQSDEFFSKIIDTYDNLITGPHERTISVSRSVPIDNVIYVDASQPLDRVVEEIVQDFEKVVEKKAPLLSS